jgi:hypothetical protein
MRGGGGFGAGKQLEPEPGVRRCLDRCAPLGAGIVGDHTAAVRRRVRWNWRPRLRPIPCCGVMRPVSQNSCEPPIDHPRCLEWLTLSCRTGRPALFTTPGCLEPCQPTERPSGLIRLLMPPELHLVNFRCHHSRPLHRLLVGLRRGRFWRAAGSRRSDCNSREATDEPGIGCASPWAFWSRPLARQIDGDLSSS